MTSSAPCPDESIQTGSDQANRLRGLLLGTAVGDALGLPAEGLSRRRIQRLYRGQWRHRLIFGRGMLSDDSEHTVFVAQCLLRHPDAPARFATRLGWCLRGWLLILPAGIGLATLRAIVKLWLGFPPDRSGVWSAGNGPAMRVALIGAFFAHDPQRRTAYVAASTRLTHSDPKALTGARAIAELAAWIVHERLNGRPALEPFLTLLRGCGVDDRDWQARIDTLAGAARDNATVAELAARLGLGMGVSGYIYDTVPVAAYAWLRHGGDFQATLSAVLDCGGDTDTVGAITGALAGATVGEAGIPAAWQTGIVDWPRSLHLLRALGERLTQVMASGQPAAPLPYFWPALPLRNLLFLLIVLAHGLRRLLPPY
jgi:ADP-ribosylglycohydrolase